MDMFDLQRERDTLTKQKHDLEFKSGQIKAKLSVSGRLPDDKYKVYVEARNKYKAKLFKVTNELREVNSRIKEFNNNKLESFTIHVESKRKGRIRFIYNSLLNLKYQYHAFAADSTRISSMRQMAAEFANRIDAIIEESKEEKWEEKGENI